MEKQQHQGIVITQTPFRVSFFGGGTDFPGYFNQEGGSVIGTAIDKYVYVTLNSLDRFLERRIRLSYSSLEIVDRPEDLEHGIVRCVLTNHALLGENDFLDINTFADLPAATGVGSSSSFTVGMLNAFYLLNGIYKTPEAIAKEAIYTEREQLKDAGGWQDQIFAAFGGFNRITFSKNNFRVEPICISAAKKQALENACMMFFTGDTRSSAKVQETVMQTVADKEREKFAFLKQIQLLTDEAFSVLNIAKSPEELVHEFGKLLHLTWVAKCNLSSSISNSKIDSMYDIAIKAGAIGGKLCGAGGGGFLLLIVPENKQASVAEALSKYKQLNIKFEDHGSRVIYSKACEPLVKREIPVTLSESLSS